MANCNCIKGNFDVLIGWNSCSKLLIEDISDWMEEAMYEVAESYDLIITVPKKPREYTVTINTDKRNKLSPEDVGIGGATFNDGIYCFKVENCGNTYTRNKLVSCSIECCIEDAVSKLKNREEVILLDEIRLLLDSCRINTEIGNLTKAKEQYNMLTKMLRNLNCKCN